MTVVVSNDDGKWASFPCGQVNLMLTFFESNHFARRFTFSVITLYVARGLSVAKLLPKNRTNSVVPDCKYPQSPTSLVFCGSADELEMCYISVHYIRKTKMMVRL